MIPHLVAIMRGRERFVQSSESDDPHLPVEETVRSTRNTFAGTVREGMAEESKR